MFGFCTSLTEAPELPATTLAEGCYLCMFCGCEQIAEAPELPATTLAESCYESMFSYCEALTEAPTLPATQLDKRCYANMFSHCSNLIGTIELPAEELPERCYYSMFEKCSKLSSVKCLATTMTGKCALLDWLINAGTDESVGTPTMTHALGTPWVNSDEDSIEETDWFVPTGWTLVNL